MRAEELDDSLLVLQTRHEHVEVHPVDPLHRQPDMTPDDLGHALCYHLPGSGRAGFASRRRFDPCDVRRPMAVGLSTTANRRSLFLRVLKRARAAASRAKFSPDEPPTCPRSTRAAQG